MGRKAGSDMNGKTAVDATLNPCTAKMDRRTHGWRNLNILFAGKRLVRIGVGGVYIDLYWAGLKRPLYVRIYNGAMVMFPGGSISWPMPIKPKKGGE